MALAAINAARIVQGTSQSLPVSWFAVFVCVGCGIFHVTYLKKKFYE